MKMAEEFGVLAEFARSRGNGWVWVEPGADNVCALRARCEPGGAIEMRMKVCISAFDEDAIATAIVSWTGTEEGERKYALPTSLGAAVDALRRGGHADMVCHLDW